MGNQNLGLNAGLATCKVHGFEFIFKKFPRF